MSRASHDPSPSGVTRREFLGRSARQAAHVAAGLTGVAAGVMTLSGTSVAASDLPRISLGVIGVRNRGRELAVQFARMPEVELRALCDVDAAVLNSAAAHVVRETSLASESGPAAPQLSGDFRRVLDDPAIQGVVIATPDHWHTPMAMLALEAGKDVYLESPATSALGDGPALIALAQRQGRIVQCGVQERSGEAIRDAIQYLHAGRLGAIRLARAWVVYRRKPIPRKVDSPAPDGVDYAGWLGFSPQREFNANRFHFNWRWFWDYGGGELSHWGSHLLDVARWGLKFDWPERIAATGGNYAYSDATEVPDTLSVQFTDVRSTLLWEHRLWSGHGIEGRSSGVAFYGEGGTLILDRGGWKVYDGEPAGANTSAADLDRAHLRNFIHCIQTRETPNCDLATAAVSAGLCQLGNLSYRLGRELRFDPLRQRLIGRETQESEVAPSRVTAAL